jgi:hypothetical protein
MPELLVADPRHCPLIAPIFTALQIAGEGEQFFQRKLRAPRAFQQTSNGPLVV